MEQKKKMKDMTAEELKAYNNERKRRSRAAEKAERLARQTLSASDYEMPQPQQQALQEHSRKIRDAIKAELGTITTDDVYVIHTAACVSFGLENNIMQRVIEPSGMLVGGYFPDGIAHEAVEHVHRFPNILNSATLKQLYDELLERVVKWSNQTHHAYSTPEFIQDVKRTLAGTFVLPDPAPTPAAPPPAPVEPPPKVPSDKEIQEHGREQLFRQLDTNLSPDACRYLNGEPWR